MIFWSGTPDNCGFSALQRAENSSIGEKKTPARVRRGFQCSSASRKFLNPTTPAANARYLMFQCSSASRKFLNGAGAAAAGAGGSFQCSSASRKFLNATMCRPEPKTARVSVLFSEPKIPQSYIVPGGFVRNGRVSVLFSEPKIPQSSTSPRLMWNISGFSALQRAENSSIGDRHQNRQCARVFQCSSASRKFLNSGSHTRFGGRG